MLGKIKEKFVRSYTPSPNAEPEKLFLNFPKCLEEEYPNLFPIIKLVNDEILAVIENKDLSILSKNSPGLNGFDWKYYLSTSMVRMIKILYVLKKHVSKPATVLDMGSYFGNFSMVCRLAGYNVTAVDSCNTYSPTLDPFVSLMQEKTY